MAAQNTAPNCVEDKISEVSADAEMLEKKLLHVKELHTKDDGSSESGDSETSFPSTVSTCHRKSGSFDLELQKELLKAQTRRKNTKMRVPKDKSISYNADLVHVQLN